MAVNTLVVVVIMAVVLVIMFVFPRKIGEASEKTALGIACEQSLEINKNIKLTAGHLVDSGGEPVKIKCATEYLDTSKKGEELTREFADHIYECWKWYSRAEGLFDQDTGTYCIICKVITPYSDEGKISNLIDFMKTESVLAFKNSTYVKGLGGETMLAPGADARYNFYPFQRGEETAIIVTFGRLNFAGQHLAYDYRTGVGILVHPYRMTGMLGCYSFEGVTSLKYKR